MEDIEDLLLKALALPAKINSDCQIKISALQRAIIKCVIQYDESTKPKTKELLREYDVDISDTIAITSVNRHCSCINKEVCRILKYDMEGVYLTLDDSSLEIGISPLCDPKDNDDYNLCDEDADLDLNDFEEIAHALLDKIYETQAK